MTKREFQIGMVGTFDVENYGDLLFPLIARAELSQRLGPMNLHCFSYRQKTLPEWPFEVNALSEFPRRVRDLDGLLIGGGHILRFDKKVAPNYFPPAPGVHHPTGYWLAPALIALNNGLPVAWNAPGLNGQVREWAAPLMKLAFGGSDYVSVRDENSKQVLARFVDDRRVQVIPDSAFGLARVLDEHSLAECTRLRSEIGLSKPYIVLQANRDLGPFMGFVRRQAKLFEPYQLLMLAAAPVNGDDDQMFGKVPAEVLRLPGYPNPLVLAQLIRQADAVVAVSLHVSISALAFGVPLFRPLGFSSGKHSILSGLDGVYTFTADDRNNRELFASMPARTGPSPAISTALVQLDEHWDRIASVFASEKEVTTTPTAISTFWQAIPGLLEERSNEAIVSELNIRNHEIEDLRNSTSWKITAPLRTFLDFWRREKDNDRPRAH